MTSFLGDYNLSVLAIPAYIALALLPHSYALNVATRGDLLKWDNRNPRSTTMKASLKERLDAETYAKYERLEACHANWMENLPIFGFAVVLGNMAGLKREGIGGLNGFVATFLAIRAIYTVIYVNNTTQGTTVLRSGLFFTGLGLCFSTIIRSAKALNGLKL